MTDPLEALDFGRLDAENDPRLLDYFLQTGVVRGTAAKGRHLVIGRKGSGKTALFRHLAATLPVEVIELDLLNYVFELHKGIAEIGLPPTRSYTMSWKLLIYSAMYARLRGTMQPRDRAKGDDALNRIGLSKNSSGYRTMLNWVKRLKRVDLPSVEGIAGLGGFETEPQAPSALSTESSEAIDILEVLLREELTRTPVTVLVDRLDDAWDGTEESANLIAGAVRATRDVYIAMGQSTPAPVITFLRTDLWERLSFNDKNKMSQDIVFLDWTDDQLADVVDLRIQRSLGTNPGQGWAKAFTTAEMRQRASAKKYITKRTMGRPRDIIAFALYALEERSNHAASIEATDIYDAEYRYSKHILDELRDEIEQHVSDFTAVVNSLKSLRKRSFAVADWFTATNANGMSADEAKAALEQLFEASAVGILRAGGAAGGSRTIYRYQDRHLRSLDSEIHQVHLALVRELSLTDA